MAGSSTNYWLHIVFIFIMYFRVTLSNECVNNTRLTNGCNTLGIFETYKLHLTPSCDEHDICYYCGYGSQVSRAACDEAFYKHMIGLCGGDVGCEWNALLYFYMTSMFGEPFYIREKLQICKKACVQDILRRTKLQTFS